MTGLTLEICLDSVDVLDVCTSPMVDRIELCSALGVGGLTPSHGLMQAADHVRAKTHAMIRPRAGDFIYGPRDIAVMCADIEAAGNAGLAGIVIGAATTNRQLDAAVLKQLIGCAGGLCITLHRVIDTLADPFAAIDVAVDLGIDRILTSGQAVTAAQGTDMIARMNDHADGRISIMAGAGVTDQNLIALAHHTSIDAFHSSASFGAAAKTGVFGLGDVTDPNVVRDNIQKLRAAMNNVIRNQN